MGDFNVCHQCHQNDKGRLVTCQTCHMKRYCIPCLYSWYSLPSLPSLYFAQKCPFCRDICRCTACLILRAKMNPHNNPHFSEYIHPLDHSSISPSSNSEPPRPTMRELRCQNGLKMRGLNDVIEEDTVRYAEENTRLFEPEAEESQTMTAKSLLYTCCRASQWKPPVYECIDDEGPSHMRLFTVNVKVEMKAESGITVLECFGDPQHRKKIAAERAAAAALWYLKHIGHTFIQSRRLVVEGR